MPLKGDLLCVQILKFYKTFDSTFFPLWGKSQRGWGLLTNLYGRKTTNKSNSRSKTSC